MDGNGCIFGWMFRFESLKITPEIISLISGIDEFKGAWRALGALSPERLTVLQQVATIESIGSSTRIEGSRLTDREVRQFLSNLRIQRFDTRDEQEVAGYADVMNLIFQSWPEITLTENHIKQLHRDLLKHSAKDFHHRGEYKKISNNVAAFKEGKQIGIVFETATPFDTPRRMKELIDWTNETLEKKRLHPLLVIGIFIVVFLEIHPFQDGNGRLSRALTTMLLLRAGYVYVPYSSLESIIEKNKEGYYLALRQTQKTIRLKNPQWQQWISFFLSSLLQQTKNLGIKIEKEKIVFSTLPEISTQILEMVHAHGRITVGAMAKLTGVSRNTLKDHFRQLTEKNHLELQGRGRGAWYTLKK